MALGTISVLRSHPPYYRSKPIILGFLLLAVSLTGCGRGGAEKSAKGAGARGANAAVPVVVEEARRQQLPLEIRAIGNVEAFSTVAIKARVAGQITAVSFDEGAEVRAGQLLFTIDPRDYQQAVKETEAVVAAQRAALGQAEANYQRDVANAANAKSQSERFGLLAKEGIVSRQENEQYQTQAVAAENAGVASKASIASARAALQGAEAKLADARLQLSYTQVRAPIAGRTGALAFRVGDIINANAEPALVTINQITPVYANFSIPEQALSDLRRYSSDGRLKVQAVPQEGGGTPATGTLNFLDNQVDQSTGTIRVKGLFPNKERLLWPGQFINVSVQLANPTELVVPNAAVRNSQEGSYVFVVKADMTTEQRTIVSPRTLEDFAVISKGLKPGEKVVVTGQLRIRAGGKVRIVKGQETQATTETVSLGEGGSSGN